MKCEVPILPMTHDLLSDMTAWRRDIHQHPELGFAEVRTSELVASLLESFGIVCHRGIGGTGIVGVLKHGEGPSIGLRADMDALPIREGNDFTHASLHEGVFHGCGHDGHTAMLLGAAKHLASSGGFSGTVHFIFQPAEEWGCGAKAMIADQLFERFTIDEVYGMHNWPQLPAGRFGIRTGAMMAAEDNFEIVITGNGGHASTPHLCRDPIPTAGEIIGALQTIVSRNIPSAENCVLSITELYSDGARNVIPSQVVIKGDVRRFDDDHAVLIKQRIEEIVAGICAAHATVGSVNYTHEFAVLINSERETQHATAAARAIVGDSNVDEVMERIAGAEDFAWMLREKPGAYIMIGGGDHDVACTSLHNPHYDFPDAILSTGADYWVRLVRDRLPANS